MDKIKSKYSMWWGVLKGALTSVSVSLVMILLFALLIKFFNLIIVLLLMINLVTVEAIEWSNF